MASGYLGKISAIVSANTADFQSKLNASAKDVQSFARSVQSNLTSASRDAARSFESIYTPLQKFERSLQAAASMKLSFKGFAGAVKDVDVLRQRLGSMKDSQISLVLKASGLKNITEVREALVGLRAKDLQIVAKVGGIEKVRELRALSAEKRVDFAINLIDSGLGRKLADAKSKVQELKAAVASVRDGGTVPEGGVGGLASEYREATAEVRRLQELGRQSIKTTLGVNVQKDADVDRILQAAERADAIRLPVVLDVLGEAAVKEAVTQSQRLRSVAEQINKPFGEAVGKLQAMSIETQAGLLPAFKRVQAQVESLKSNIESGVLPATAIAQQFDEVEKRALAAAGAVGRLAEAEQKTARLKTGRELAFAAPQLAATLGRGEEVGNRAASLPSSVIQANPRIAEMLTEIDGLANKAVAAFAKLESRAARGLDTSSSQKQVDALRAKLEVLFDEFDRTYQIHVDTEQAKKDFDELTAKAAAMRERNAFVITGRPQNMEQADARRGQLEGDISGLDRSQRQNYKPLLEDASLARLMGDLDKVNDVLDQIAFKVATDKAFNVKTAQAKKDLNDLKATMDSLRDESNFVISAKVQNAGQAEAEIKRIVGSMEQLDAGQRQALQPKVDAAISSLGAKDAKTGLPDIAAMSAAVKDLSDAAENELVIKVKADEAKKSVDSLKDSLGSIADRIGDPSEPVDRLRKAVDAANAAIAKMPAGALKTKLEGDLNSEKIRIEAMARPSAPPPIPVNIDAAAGRANAIAAAAVAGTPAKAASNPLGADFGTAERQVASLQSTVMSLQSSLEKLPVPMQAQFIPAINKVRDAFQKLTPSSTAAEIDAVTKKAAGLERAFARAGQAAEFGGTLGEALNAAAITKTEKQLGFIRSKLLEVGATASGPVAAAFNAYSAAAAAAANAGVSGTAATTKQLDGLIAKIGEALVAEGKLTAAQGKAFSKSVGDVGRAGADKFALFLNQAAFAVDDFMSSTGGLEFKLRAVSNNITQMGFVLGGTTGLFVGLGAVIAGQAAVGLIKWINNGRSAEDQTKALNEALARQKSLVEELAEAFKSLGESMSRGTLSAVGEQAADFARQVEEIQKKQAEVRKSRVADLDPEVQKERAEQNKLKGQLEKETDPGRRIAITREMADSQRRERDASAAAVARLPAEDEARVRVRESMIRIGLSELGPNRGDDPTRGAREQQVRERAAARAEAIPVGARPEDIRAQMAGVNQQIEDAKAAAAKPSPLGFATSEVAAKEILKLEQLLRSLEQPLAKAIDDAAVEIADSSRGPAEQIRQAQEEVAKAVEAGLPGARVFGAELDKIGGRLSEAYKKLREVVSGKDASGRELTVDEKEARTRQAQGEIDGLNAERVRIAAQADAFRYERTVDPQRQIDARMARARSNLGAAGLEDGRIARRMREIENERATIQRQSTLPEFQNPLAQGALQKREQALNAEAAAIEAATIAIKAFAAALDQASQESKSNLNAAQQAADEARRADLGNSTPQTREARQRAEADLQRQREAEQKVQVEVAVARDQLEKLQKTDADRIRQIDEELKGGGKPADKARAQLAEERAAVEAKVSGSNSAATSDAEQARKRSEAAKARRLAVLDEFKAAKDLGIDTTGMQLGAVREAIRGAGRGDVADKLAKRSDATFDEMLNAGFAAEEAGSGLWDAITQAGEELAAATARRAEVVNEGTARLAEMDAKIAAVPAGDGREELIRERAALSAKLEARALEFQDKVDKAGLDASSREEEQRKSAARGLDLARTPSGKFAEQTNRGLADIQAYFQRRIDENRGLRPVGDAEAQAASEERFRREREKEARTATAEGRGRDLGMTDRERFRRDFAEGAGADINARAKQLRDGGQDPTDFLRQAISNQMKQVAPMLQSFQDERQNALLQGPSRAALNVSDVSTSQGQSELTRLLRGDDPAKDVNLAELQRQTQALEDIKNTLKDANPGVLL
jgi:hypothetical protein